MNTPVGFPSRVRAVSRAALLRRFAQRAFEAAALATLVTVLSAAGRARAAEPWPQVPLPPKADVQWVGQSMRVNGVPTRIMQFQSRAGRGEVAEYYRAYWSGGYAHAPSVHALGATATVIGQKHGPYLMTVKVEDSARGASHGLISVAQVIGSKVARDPGELPLMGGAHVVSVVESDDPGKHSREVVVVNPQAAASVTQYYQAAFGNAGWIQVQGNESPLSAAGAGGSFIVFARGASEMQLSIVEMRKLRGSMLVANLVTKDTGPDVN